MSKANGGDAKVKDWSRLFLSPGMGHCSGGSATLDTFDLLSAAVNWVEKNHAAGFDHGDRPRIPRPKPPVVSIPAARAIQRHRQSGRRRQLQLPVEKRFSQSASKWAFPDEFMIRSPVRRELRSVRIVWLPSKPRSRPSQVKSALDSRSSASQDIVRCFGVAPCSRYGKRAHHFGYNRPRQVGGASVP